MQYKRKSRPGLSFVRNGKERHEKCEKRKKLKKVLSIAVIEMKLWVLSSHMVTNVP